MALPITSDPITSELMAQAVENVSTAAQSLIRAADPATHASITRAFATIIHAIAFHQLETTTLSSRTIVITELANPTSTFPEGMIRIYMRR